MSVTQNQPEAPPQDKPGLSPDARPRASILQVFVNWRMLVILLTGFSSGLPFGLTGKTLQAWLASEKVDLAVIGVLAVVTLPYSLKFIWAPLMDLFVPPFLGRRRGWMLITQIALVCGIAAMAAAGVTSPTAIGALALLVAFCSASQDIVIDAFRAETLKTEEYGAGSALYMLGYRIGFVCSAALALVLSDHMSWQTVYFLMGGAMIVGIATTLLSPEPKAARPPQKLSEALVLPFAEFLSRRGAIEMLAFILIYKCDWAMVDAMTTPFMMEIGFSKTDIGAVTNGAGIVFTIIGTLIGGAAITRMGIHRSLWIFGLLQGLAGISFAILAILGKSYPMMATAIVVENTCTGMATSAFVAFIMSLCNKRFTATQFALLTSLMALGRTASQMPAGWLAKHTGWPAYFAVATLIAIPGLVLLLRYKKWEAQSVGKMGTP